MTILGLNSQDRFAATSYDVLNRFGVHLTTGYDFEEYRDILAKGRPDHILGAPFDPSLHKLDSRNSMWVVGHDSDGHIMHTQALRMLDLQGDTLGTYLRRRFKDFPPSGLDLDMERSRFRAGPGAKHISGRVCYHGEVWMGGKPGQFRGTGVSSILGRFAFLTALQQWSPDYVFGFMPKPVAHKGFVERQGYMHAEPFALRWYIKNEPDPLEGFLAYMSREDMHFVLDLPESDLEALAA
ncbi:MAG: hypothetical protein ABJL99_13240 [Aliishimia sp.]